MAILSSTERKQASDLGMKLVQLLSSVKPLVAGFALASVVKAMPQEVRNGMRAATAALQFAQQRLKAPKKALPWVSTKESN